MRVLPVRDDEIAAIASDPRLLDGAAMAESATELYDSWRNIDYLLGGKSFLLAGDVELKHSISEPAHAIRSSGMPALAAQLDAISDGDVRERLGADVMRAAGMRVSQYHNVDNMLRDILPAMHGLRTAVVRAVADKLGLVIWRYEWL